jgi:signal transduction histidine kinase
MACDWNSTTLHAALNRPARLAALAATQLLDTPLEPSFDTITRLCTRALDVPIALVSLVDGQRQFFKSVQGLAEPWATRRQTPLSHSICKFVAARTDDLLIDDARSDDVLAQHPAVTELGVVAYAGVPLTFRGETIGAFCAVDTAPRQWKEEDLEVIREYAALVIMQIERDVARTELDTSLEVLRTADRRKTEFLATLGHELRNPIAPIRTSIHVLRQASPGSPLARQSAEIIERQVMVMRRLVDDLLDVNRIERDALQLERCRVRLDEVLDAAVESVQSAIDERGLRLVQQRPVHAIWMDADPMRLSQALVNLLGNAAKFTPPGGRIDLVATVHGGELQVAVRDTGIGIDPGSCERIFELFAQSQSGAEPSHGGLGIGLALARRLVELHGGSLSVHSDGAGCGATFTLRLPVRRRGD